MIAVSEIARQQVLAALGAAAETEKTGDVPVGAVVFDRDGAVLGVGYNTRHKTGDYTGHAEIAALNAAAQTLGSRVLSGCTLAITLEPCVMCAGVILASRVSRVVFGAWDDKAGAAGSVYDILRDGKLPHKSPEVIGGVLAAECVAVLQQFFAAKR